MAIENMDSGLDPNALENDTEIANPGGPYEALVGDVVKFDGSGSTEDGTIEIYDWDFGDATIAFNAGPNPVHIYSSADNYTVTLTVTDNDNNSNVAQTTATISESELRLIGFE